MEIVDQEICREKVFVPKDMSRKEIIAKYGVSGSCASSARRKGWIVKNYSRNQIIIDRDHFNAAISYSIAKQVFWKNFRWNPVAQTLKEDLIQEAVSLMIGDKTEGDYPCLLKVPWLSVTGWERGERRGFLCWPFFIWESV